MTKIGLILKSGISEATTVARRILEWAKTCGHVVVAEMASAKLLGDSIVGVPVERLPSEADIIVSLGGDGTLIGVARYVASNSVVLLGVNFGNLGFLTEIRPEELLSTLDDVVAGRARSGERTMLRASVNGGGKTVFTSQALNDVVIHKGTKDRLLEMDVAVDGKPMLRVRADGLIIATPTGSTAYSLAAGGSIAYPELPVVLVTPICPHSLTVRPLVLGGDSKISVSFPAYDGQIYATVDGQVSHEVAVSQRVEIEKSEHRVRIVRSPSRSYFDILSTKLNWGIPNRAN